MSRRLGRRDLLRGRTGRIEPEPVSEGHWIRVHRRAMACRFEAILDEGDAPHVAAVYEALDEVARIEAALTVFRDTSEIARLNQQARRGPVTLDREWLDLLRQCHEIHASTDGAFDITSTPLSRCWGFLDRAAHVPSPEKMAAARACVGMGGVHLDASASTVRFASPGLELNLGAIGKGYALDRMAARLRERGIARALLSAAGSSIVAWGGRGPDFAVDLRSPLVARPRLARVRLRDGALGTSGAGEQFVMVDGVRYGHVLDPRTGWPARGVLSATVITGDAARADALSTAFLIGGPELARRYCADHGEVLVLLMLEGHENPQSMGSFGGATIDEE